MTRTRTRTGIVPSTYLGRKWIGRGEPYGISNYYLDPSTPASYETCYDEVHPGPSYNSGGPLFIKKLMIDDAFSVKNEDYYPSSNGLYHYQGGFVPGIGFIRDLEQDLNITDWESDVSSRGPSAWNRFKPGKPGANLAQFIGELKDLPRMLKTSAQGFKDAYNANPKLFGSRQIGNQWLNQNFGWLPFIQDLRSFYKTYKNLDRAIAQIKRDNGKWIKREGFFDGNEDFEVISVDETYHGHYPTLNTYFYSGSPYGRLQLNKKVTYRTWFSGRFRYWIPDIESPNWSKRAVANLFGASINPALIWELTPWSWLIDWVSNVGDVLSNLHDETVDNLAAKYAYVMGTHITTLDYCSTMYLWNGNVTATWSFSMEKKARCKANPFGFSLQPINFSARQLSILAALGLSRLNT